MTALITVLIGIAIYAGSIGIMCHNAMDYDPAWDEPREKHHDN